MPTVKLRSEESLEWLYQSITKTLGRVRENGTENARLLELLEGLLDDLHAAVTKDAEPSKTTRPQPAKQAAAPPAKLCPKHPTYGAKRSPKTDCETCWEVYSRLNPLRADLAKRRHAQKKRAKS